MLVSALILAAALSQPNEAPVPDILVPKLRLGMDKEEFYALFPKYRATFGPGCTAKVEPNIRDHKVHSLWLGSAEKEPPKACGKFVRDWAYATFGKPKDTGDRDVLGANCAPGNGVGWSFTAQSAACGQPDVEDWADWEPQNRKYSAGLSVERKSADWSFGIYPR